MNFECQEYRERIAAMVTGYLSPEEEEQLEQHLSECPDCREYLELLREDDRLLAGFVSKMDRIINDLERRIISTLSSPPPDAEQIPLSAERAVNRRLFRYVAIAAILAGVILGGALFRGRKAGTVAWAEVIARVEKAQNYICRTRQTLYITGEENSSGVRYHSREYGIRKDTYDGDHLAIQTYTLPDERAIIGVIPDDEAWFRIWLRDNEIENVLKGGDAQEMVEQFKSEPHRNLGQRRINGILAEGIEVRNPEDMRLFYDNSRFRLWVDTGTNWPIRLEGELSSDGGRLRETFVMHDFQWNVDLPKSEFEPNIPYHYSLELELDTPVVDEANAIEGLHICADVLRGRYPRRLVLANTLMQYFDEARRNPRNTRQRLNDIERLNQLRSTFEFYDQLLKEENDVAYYGHRVMKRDFDRVLMRWQLPDGRYRIIYGDLRNDTVSSERMRELERRY